MPAIKNAPTEIKLTLTASERKAAEEIKARADGLAERSTQATADYWRAIKRECRTRIDNTDGSDFAALDKNIADLDEAARKQLIARAGELQFVKSALRKAAQRVLGGVAPVLRKAAERCVEPLVKQADALQRDQDDEHARLGIEAAPCPAAESLRQQAAAKVAAASKDISMFD
jgi:hypothetical protein